MADVVLYTKPGCPYCTAAKSLLRKKGVDFTDIVASNDPEKKAEMIQKSGGRTTFPQIFIDGKHIGGSDDIHALDARGGLDPLLAA
ncbi:glutaredoxin 3 [Brevundimonas vitis]|uniref:Glutaredoxin n=1 Tax=Brevundimonas vitisensis TaxID=2800818 RepID=A0ABX7BMH8_9CAUL|nr:glutaredoxin 3 [Brevundimonas vitisensis]QQQ17551.1 glutaredoxin 3 [Brevundimonas vitisensis]